jgi:hypothetical protein
MKAVRILSISWGLILVTLATMVGSLSPSGCVRQGLRDVYTARVNLARFDYLNSLDF